MPFIKVPGTAREIWFELHEPQGQEIPWPASVGTAADLTPEQFATEMVNPNSEWDFSFAHETATTYTPAEAELVKAQARRFEPLLRKARADLRGIGAGGRGRGGRPANTAFSVADDIAVIAIYLIKIGMKRQAAINQAADYWINGNKQRMEPAKRLIDAAMARIRRGGITNLPLAVEAVRVKYALSELPEVNPRKVKPTGRIK